MMTSKRRTEKTLIRHNIITRKTDNNNMIMFTVCPLDKLLLLRI